MNHRLIAPRKITAQSGFTLLELMVALLILMLVVVSVQRYVGGVLNDRDALATQQDQTNQVNIVLSNIQNDVRRAGFTPVASAIDIPTASAVEVLPCTASNCVGNRLLVRYWTLDAPAHDCAGSVVKEARTLGWVLVENAYYLRKNQNTLTCAGNGGNGNQTLGLLDDVQSLDWQLNSDGVNSSLLSVCITTQSTQRGQVLGGAPARACVGALPNINGEVYRTTEMDMRVPVSTLGVQP